MTTQKLIDASQKLHKLCDFLEEQKNDSRYSAEAWQELEEENSRLRMELAQIIKIHEELAREYGNFKEYISKKGYSI